MVFLEAGCLLFSVSCEKGIMGCFDYLFGDSIGEVEGARRRSTSVPCLPATYVYLALANYGLFHPRDGPVTHLSQGDANCVPMDLWIQDSGIIYLWLCILSFGM